MANDLRGEIDWVVEDHTYTLRLSLADLKALQLELGIPTLKWRERLDTQDLGMVEIDAILTKALKRGDPDKFRKPSDIAVVCEAAGFTSCLQHAVQVLVEGLNDPVERRRRHEEQLKAAEDGALPEPPLP